MGSTGNIGYSQRWWLSALLPFMLLVPFAVIFAISECKDAQNKEKRKELEDRGTKQIQEWSQADKELKLIKQAAENGKKQADIDFDKAKRKADATYVTTTKAAEESEKFDKQK